MLTIVDHLCLVISLAYLFFDSFEQWFNSVCEQHNITHRKVKKFGLGFNGIAKMLWFLLVVINSDYSIEVLLSYSPECAIVSKVCRPPLHPIPVQRPF